ncbi:MULTISPECIES: hypothetical protein [Nostocales]|nr:MULTISPECIES: hypothetical protein [Nostocales]MCX5983252.1 hypothetical protein [Nostocales cyanobacterium LacPavin_0920_SED1_MAG_38_18]
MWVEAVTTITTTNKGLITYYSIYQFIFREIALEKLINIADMYGV